VLLNRVGDIAQQAVAGKMAAVVVDLFEPVDVDVGENEVPAPVARAVDLAPEHAQPQLPAKGTGELVKLGSPQFGPRLFTIAAGRNSIDAGRSAVGGRALAISRRFAPVSCALISRRLGVPAIRRGQRAVRNGPAPIVGGLPAVPGPLINLRFGLVAIRCIVLAISRRVSAVLGGVPPHWISFGRIAPVGIMPRGHVPTLSPPPSRLAIGRISIAIGSIAVAISSRVLTVVGGSVAVWRPVVGVGLGLLAISGVPIAISRRMLTVVGGSVAVWRPVIGLRLGPVAVRRRGFPLLSRAFAVNRSLASDPAALLPLPDRLVWLELNRRIVWSSRHRSKTRTPR
jgi:hypothetical protein